MSLLVVCPKTHFTRTVFKKNKKIKKLNKFKPANANDLCNGNSVFRKY